MGAQWRPIGRVGLSISDLLEAPGTAWIPSRRARARHREDAPRLGSELTGLGEAELQGVVQVARAKAAQVVVDQLEPPEGAGPARGERGCVFVCVVFLCWFETRGD